MHLFRIYPKTIETIKVFQDKLLNHEFNKDDPKEGIFHLVDINTYICEISNYNTKCSIISPNGKLIDFFVL